MSIVEYYYPLATLNVRTQDDKKYFDVSINTVNNTKINFAIETGGVKTTGYATQYYIQPINNDTDKTKFDMASNYLVIKHNTPANPATNFYVAFPLYIAGDGEDISSKEQSDRMNGRLSQSINNLKDVTKSIQFSLESVISSMKSFAPTGYYELIETPTPTTTTTTTTTTTVTPTTTTTTPLKKIYVLNKPIYIKNLDTSSFYKGDITIPQIESALKTATVNRVKVTRTCLKPITKSTCTPLFYGLAKTQQVRIDYLNLIYGLLSLILIFIFYYIFTTYLTNNKKPVFYGILLALALVVIPIGSTKGVYESKLEKVNVSDLQHSIIFARYFILTVMFSFVIIIGLKNIEEFFTKNFNFLYVWTMIWNKLNEPNEKLMNIFIFISLWVLISSSIYIFIPTPNECLL